MIKNDDLVLCTVTKIEGTTVFVSIEDNRTGTITFSEVAPGRIRNIREYVVPNKKIVCKVLRVLGDHAELSLRRVTSGERDSVMQSYKQALVLTKILKPLLKDKTDQAIEKIKDKHDILTFLDEARQTPTLWEKVLSKKEASEISTIIGEKVDAEKEAKAEIKVSSLSESGLEDIKKFLTTDKAEIRYLGSSKFSVSVKAKDYKLANQLLEQLLESLKSSAKKNNLRLEVKND